MLHSQVFGQPMFAALSTVGLSGQGREQSAVGDRPQLACRRQQLLAGRAEITAHSCKWLVAHNSQAFPTDKNLEQTIKISSA